MSSVVLLPTAPEPPPPGAPQSLADIEREVASRLGPFWDLTATGGTSDTVVVAGLRTNSDVGGFEGLYLLRRDAVRENDRVRTVERRDGPSGSLVVDFPYEDTPIAGERVELHHLHPDLQLFVDVQAALRRCYLLDILAVIPPPEASAPAGAPTLTGGSNGWVVWRQRAPAPNPGVLSSVAGADPGGPGAVLDLTAQAFWLTSTRQVLAVTSQDVAIPAAGRYGAPSAAGWSCFASRGHLYLGIPASVPLDGLTVRAYRDAFGLVGGVDTPGGPQADADELAVPLDYVAAFAHVEAWRRHRDRLEAAASEGRFATQVEAAAEATRVAALYADFLFRPQTERGDRVASPFGDPTQPSQLGLGGTGNLAAAAVNQNNWGREP